MLFNVLKPSYRPLKALLCSVTLLGGCAIADLGSLNTQTANRLASAAWMVSRDIPADNFILRGYERIHKQNAPANIYIEGDGVTLGDPTPRNPIALHLASKDNADNLIYLARPCQYTGLESNNPTCNDPAIWREGRYSQKIINAYNAALNEIIKRYDIKGFNLIGYDGGAAIALLLASQRHDILSVRTVAGIHDHAAYTSLTGHTELSGSLNPKDFASKLANIPQYHFVGGQDSVVPSDVLQSYLQAMPPSSCVHTKLVDNATHDAGWVNQWPDLLKLPITCSADIDEDGMEYMGEFPSSIPAYSTKPTVLGAPVNGNFSTKPEKP